MSPAVTRMLTIGAAALLAFDGAALVIAGWWSGRLVLALVGIVFFVSSGLVLVYWRWYCRRMEDIAASRRSLGDEVREMHRLLRRK